MYHKRNPLFFANVFQNLVPSQTWLRKIHNCSDLLWGKKIGITKAIHLNRIWSEQCLKQNAFFNTWVFSDLTHYNSYNSKWKKLGKIRKNWRSIVLGNFFSRGSKSIIQTFLYSLSAWFDQVIGLPNWGTLYSKPRWLHCHYAQDSTWLQQYTCGGK